MKSSFRPPNIVLQRSHPPRIQSRSVFRSKRPSKALAPRSVRRFIATRAVEEPHVFDQQDGRILDDEAADLFAETLRTLGAGCRGDPMAAIAATTAFIIDILLDGLEANDPP